MYSSTEKLFRQRLPNARGLHDVALHLDDPLGFPGEATAPVKLAVQSLPDKNLLQIPFSGTRGSGLPSENGKCMSSHSNPGGTLQIPACPGVPPWGRTELDVFRGLFRTIIRYGRAEATERIFRNAASWWMNDCCSGDKLLMWTNSQGASRIRLLS